MFRIERSSGDGNWATLMASPHRITINDLNGPPEDSSHNFPPSVTAGNKSAFTGKPGWFCRVRYEDTAIEIYVWDKIPVNEFDLNTEEIWGWKLITDGRHVIPAERLHPSSVPFAPEKPDTGKLYVRFVRTEAEG